MTAEEMTGSREFMYLPLGRIMVEEQIRTGIDTDRESFNALMESIKDRGVLEPLLVTPKDGNYLLLCGERRFFASRKLALEAIPVRVMDAVTQKDEILALQLTENMQREDLNPVDQAKGAPDKAEYQPEIDQDGHYKRRREIREGRSGEAPQQPEGTVHHRGGTGSGGGFRQCTSGRNADGNQ
jgi:ParB-like chromosome segregation protein Spo0J